MKFPEKSHIEQKTAVPYNNYCYWVLNSITQGVLLAFDLHVLVEETLQSEDHLRCLSGREGKIRNVWCYSFSF